MCRFAFSGGRQTEKEHRELGADLSVDVPYKWLEFFLDDDAECEHIGKEYGAVAAEPAPE
jgi:tryptophanyl-tRNA synthetase